MILDYISNATALPFSQQVTQGFSNELHWSSNYIISFVLRGSLEIHYKNHTRSFKKNYIYFFPPFETYSYVTSTPDAKVLTFMVEASYIHRLCLDAPNLLFQRNHLTFDPSDGVYQSICKEFATIIFNNLKNDTCYQLKLITAITNLMVTLIEHYGLKPEVFPDSDYSQERNMQILEYISNNYQKKISVTHIAQHLSLHPQYFSSLFNKQFRTSFPEYLTNYRINQSIQALAHSQDSILDIALDYGFSNHKTYAAAFRKYYDCSPTDYRKGFRVNSQLEQSSDAGNTERDYQHYDLFSFFRQFIQEDNQSLPKKTSLQNQKTLELNPKELNRTSYFRQQEPYVSAGRAYAILRSEVQAQILQAKRDFLFKHLRFRDIFSDDLYVYSEDENKNPIFSWHTLDNVFDFMVNNNITPFPEIGYMPERLASKKQYSGWEYHPNISYPKSVEKWKLLIKNFLTHLIHRYGIGKVKTWHFDFWTAPDLNIKAAFWHETMDDFFHFYHETYLTFQEVDPTLLLGSPNFSTLTGFPWYEKFFQFCYLNHIFPKYISIHTYGCEPATNADSIPGFSEMNISSFSINNQELVSSYIKTLQQIMNRNGFRDLDIIVSDWNLNFIPKDLIRDSCYMGPYISHTVNQTLMHVKGICYWSLSDIHEDFFPENSLFGGGPGLMDVHGLKKASYNTLELIMKLGDKILEQKDYYMFVQKGEIYQLYLYNLAQFDYLFSLIDKSAIDEHHRYGIYRNTDDLLLNIMIHLPKGEYYIKKYEVNRNYGSAYDLWGNMGAPKTLTKDEEDYLKESSNPHITIQMQQVDSVMILDTLVPAHGVQLIEVVPKQGL